MRRTKKLAFSIVQQYNYCMNELVIDASSPFAGIKTLFDIKHDDIMQSLRETREENQDCN